MTEALVERTVKPASHLDRIGFSDIVSIRNTINQLRGEGKTVHGFHGGEPDFNTPQPIKDAMADALAKNYTRYGPSSGLEELREAIAAKLRTFNRLDVQAANVLVTVGGMQGLAAAFEAALDPGDDILMFSPYWTPTGYMIEMVEARPILVPVEQIATHGLRELLERSLTPRTRAIYYNTPSNPTGRVFSRAEAEQVAAFALEHNLIVIADEAYEHIVYEEPHVSIGSLDGMAERTISVYTLSKSYAMTGWRIGYVAAPLGFVKALEKVVLYTTNGVSTPTQWAALAALAMPREFFAEKLAAYRVRRDLLVDGLNGIGLKSAVPGGSFYAFPRVDAIHPDSRVVAARMLEEAQVATIPGSVFGPHGEGFVRFGFAVPQATIEAGLASLRAWLERRG